jgi:arylsulfatase A-like enzyme
MAGCLALSQSSILCAEKPHVLFIAVDDLNDYISPLDNHPGIQTPNFERLSARSVTFANAHCAAPACHPSRVAMMTGVHPTTSGIYRNLFGAHGPRWRHESPALADAVVLSQHFRDHGYRAVGGGKIFHTLQWTPGDSQNDPDAWDAYRGDPLDPISADWPRPKFPKHQEDGFVGKRPLSNHLFGAAVIEQSDETFGDQLVVDWAIEQMQQTHDQPLFLAVGLFRPHIPWEVSQKWFDLYPLDEVQLPETRDDDLDDAHDHGRRNWHKWVKDNDQWKILLQGYLASISYVDHQLGRLLDALDASPMKDNTIVVLWADHGFHIGEKENWEKFALWDQTTHVPLFIHAPGFSQDGEQTQQPATLTDVYPTLCELAGLPVPQQCTGESLVPQLRDPQTPRRPAVTSYQFDNETAPSHAVADAQYRLIRYGNGFEELYDLVADPNEFTNRADDAGLAQVKSRLAKHLPAEVAPNRTVPTDSPFHRGRAKPK